MTADTRPKDPIAEMFVESYRQCFNAGREEGLRDRTKVVVDRGKFELAIAQVLRPAGKAGRVIDLNYLEAYLVGIGLEFTGQYGDEEVP